MVEPIVSIVARRGNRAARRLGAGVVLPGLVAAALLFGPAALEAQDDDPGPSAGSVSLTARGGLGIPVDSDALNAITKTGGSFGGELSLHLTQRFAITAGADYQMLEGALDDVDPTVQWPDMSLLHATAGPEFQFVSPETRWIGTLAVGAGITRLDMSETLDDGSTAPEAIEHTGLTFRGAVKLGYRATETVTLFLEPGAYLSTLDRTLTADIAAAAPELDESFDVGWTIPLQAGVRFRLE